MICIVGDILTDVILGTPSTPYKMRLGGIVHMARGLWAMGVEYAVAYFAPSYMDGQIVKYLSYYGCKTVHKIGDVKECPYTMLIGEAKEIGNQGYEFLYRDCVQIDYDNGELMNISRYESIMLVSGNYDISKVVGVMAQGQDIHIDIANNIKSPNLLSFGHKASTLFVSTSSELFQSGFTTIDDFFALLSPYAEKVVLKENRGGCRAYDAGTGVRYDIPSQTTTIVHSVGVGDVFDCAVIAAPVTTFEERLYVASWISMHYAKTTFCDDFKKAVSSVFKIPIGTLTGFEGCFLPWESRQKGNIYIAAPDFDFLDTTPVNKLCESLEYHHFKPRRPIKEIGQMAAGADKQERQRLYHGDMAILSQCNMLVAVLLNNDPGTLIEIGMAVQKGMPTIVYDPYGIAYNCMLTESPTLLSNDMDEVLAKVFIEYSKQFKNGTL